ncbi:NtrC family transcriptional regulator [Bdellovibrio bacteriovorus]|uniref:NtrC family transcriptional regulator n=1 Tax=Bdellovibrio bacteriovorus TaxID=959 RepID=A0A150WLQ7_BDEBC|nr:sigma-54 dependent transcriptional regulator [Bdellovibrio bacteriovorus]KYG64939.1 NtrC family transcriptional regulator [Bdellovibrio bacteriovorus]
MNGNEDRIIAHSPHFISILEKARKVAASSANVLITGESGTGKELIARYIHEKSARDKEKFIPINCSAIPEHLLEAELFGHSKGAFTGASSSKPGLFEEAHGGTLFLDEIGDMDLHLQSKLLRVIQEKKVKRVGENHYRPLDIRILAATHNDLNSDVQNKKFREDLFFRLNVVPLEIPPLRERTEDIQPLAQYFLQKYSARHHSHELRFGPEVFDFLRAQAWVGNVRELENSIERAVVLCDEPEISVDHIQGGSRKNALMMTGWSSLFDRVREKEGRLLSLEEFSRHYIEYALHVNKGAREKTAKDLGIDRKTLYRRTQSTDSTELVDRP